MLTDFLEHALQKADVTLDEFRELCVRLLNYGVLSRNESQTEQQLYDRYLRCSALVEDYLSVIGVRIYHERRFTYLRLYPPGARVPGMEDAAESAFGGSLRSRLRQDEVALVLVLRLQYDKAVREGQVDEEGYVAESLESLGIAMKNLLGRSLPDKLTERKRLFQRLRQLRLIDYRQEEEMDVGEAWLKIHPMIVEFVGDEALTTLEQALPAATEEDETEGEAADVS